MGLKFLEVIKYDPPAGGALVYKHEAEDFNTSSTLIVHESQVAIFMKNGQIADVFEAGRYVLKTENIPLLRRIMNLPTGGESTFHCQVYFINMAEQMAMKWGTDSTIQFIEPTYNFPIEIGASGEMSIRIQNPAMFLVRLVGLENTLTTDRLIRYFRGILMNRVKSHLARAIKEQQLNIFEIDSNLDVLSQGIHARLRGDFEEYGVSLPQFLISTVVRPEEDPGYIRVKKMMQHRHTDIFEAQTKQQVELINQQTEAQKRIMEAQSMAEKRRLEGYSYQEERSFDVAEKAVQNENVGQFTSMGMGLGMLAGVGGAVGGAVSGMVGGAFQAMPPQPPVPTAPIPEPVEQPEEQVPQAEEQAAAGVVCQCGTVLPAGAKFCYICGAQQAVRCAGCGAELVSGAKFCFECGRKV